MRLGSSRRLFTPGKECHPLLVRAYVGVTDGQWYRFLAERPHLDEVNFWRPGGPRGFGLEVGSPFLFKTHRADGNLVVGGGLYSDSPRNGLRVSEAWEIFGEANGAPSFEALLRQIQMYRPSRAVDPDPLIGCLLLRDVRFFHESEAVPAPEDFAPNIVQGRSYLLDQLELGHPVAVAVAKMLGASLGELGTARIIGEMFGADASSRRRLGQKSFKSMVLTAYQRCCAITGDRIQPVLEAAHILPVERGGEHRLDNGLLLRSDVHTLFDAGYLTIDTRHRLRVSPLIRER
jgi:putative restriction endonuclease